MTKMKKSRAIYNFLGFLGDVGGLFEGLRLITSALLGSLSSGGFIKWFVSQIFFRRPPDSAPGPSPQPNNICSP